MKQAIKGALPKPVFNALKKIKTRVRQYARLIRYAGKNVECPFCGKTFSRFRPTGAIKRPFWASPKGRSLLQLVSINVSNALCPWCGSGERHRLLYFYLRDQMSTLDSKWIKLLDVAPDDFLWDKVYCKADIKYVSIDITPARCPTFIMDLTNLAFDNNTFDVVICYHVFEHITDDVQAMKEIYRVLKPTGWGILQVPIWAEKTVEDMSVSREKYAEFYGHKDHVRRYGLDYIERLRSIGFNVLLDSFASTLPDDFIKRYGLFRSEELYLCKKT